MSAETPPQYRHVFARLQDVKPAGERWNARCPSHDDQRASLSLMLGRRGQLLVKCHAPHGCTVLSITGALGLRLDDLFLDSKRLKMSAPTQTQKKAVGHYDYRDEGGVLLLRVVRYEPKDFRQCRPNPAFDPTKAKSKDNSEFIWDREGVRLVPYRLPEVIAELKKNPKRWVWVMEGEADVDVAWKNGMIATCNPMGALKWHLLDPKSLEVFRDANVCVIPDDDPVDQNQKFSPGVKHAAQVCDSLRSIAKTVRLLPLSERGQKEDFRDWWAAQEKAGVTVDSRKKMLGEMALKMPLWGQPVDKPADKPAEAPKEWLPTDPEAMHKWLRGFEGALVAAGLCEVQDLNKHLTTLLQPRGFAPAGKKAYTDMTADDIKFAVDGCRKFAVDRRASQIKHEAPSNGKPAETKAPSVAALPDGVLAIMELLAEFDKAGKMASKVEWFGAVAMSWANAQEFARQGEFRRAAQEVLRMGAATCKAIKDAEGLAATGPAPVTG